MAPVLHAPKCIQLLKLLVRSRSEVRIHEVLTVFDLLSLEVLLAHLSSVKDFSEVYLIVSCGLGVEETIGPHVTFKSFATVVSVSKLPIHLYGVRIRHAGLRLYVETMLGKLLLGGHPRGVRRLRHRRSWPRFGPHREEVSRHSHLGILLLILSQLGFALLCFDVFFFRVVFQLVLRMHLFQNSFFPVSDLVNFVSLLDILVVFSSFGLVAPSLWLLPERLRKRLLVVESCSLRPRSMIFSISEPIAHHGLRVSY